MPGPIKPEEVKEFKRKSIPEEVFQAFNELIVKNYVEGRSVVKQNDVIDLIISRLSVIEYDIYHNGWLDVEPVYREAGWKVRYDRPGYNESYDSFFVFENED